MSYADEYTDEKLNALEKRVNTVYAKAYKDTRAMASEYFKTLEGRYNREYTSMMASTNTFEDFAKWYKKNRDATSNDAVIKAYWSKNQNTYTETSFKAWYKTQVTRGERYEKMAENMAKRMTGANEVAAAYVNDTTPSIYSLNRNYAAYQVNKIIPSASFEIYNEQAVKNLMMDKKNVTEFRTLRVNPVRDYAWNSEQIKTVLTSGIIRGLSIDHLTDEFLTVMMRNRSAAIRNARTAVTSAQNAGRLDTMDAAEKQGIKVKKQWHSMEDARVRYTHALLNGQIRDKDKKFSNGLMFPGDSSGNPAEVYNCRCRMEYILTDYMTDKSVETYDAWDKLTPTEKKAEKDKYNAWMAEQEKNRLNRGKVETDYTFDFKVPEAETVETPVVTFAEFVPAKTMDEAIEFANTLVDKSKWAAVGVNYSGIGLDVANEINRVIYEFENTFDYGKLGGIFVPRANSREGQMLSGAHMGYSSVRDTLFINKDGKKTLKSANEAMQKEKIAVAGYIKNPSNYVITNPRVKRVMDASLVSGRGTVPDNVAEEVIHELGHALEKAVKKHPDYAEIMANKEQYAVKISGYATDNDNDYIAESFTSYMKGETIIDSKLRAIFEGLKRRNNG